MNYFFTTVSKSEQATENVRLFRNKKKDFVNETIENTCTRICNQVTKYSLAGRTSIPAFDIEIILEKPKDMSDLSVFTNQDKEHIYDTIKEKMVKSGFIVSKENDPSCMSVSWKDPDESTPEEKEREEKAEWEKEIIEDVSSVARVVVGTVGKVALRVNGIDISQ